jgi:hypothetical protein
LEAARRLLQGVIAAEPDRFRQNVFTGALLRDEDSPGNCVLRETADGYMEYVWFDIEGAEQTQKLWP